MNAEICLQKLQLCGVLSFATVGKDGEPQTRCISAIHYEPDSLYFFTARGKNFCSELLADGRVQILAYTRFKEMIRLSGKAVPLPETEQAEMVDRIFSEQPYLANIYPGSTREIGIVFGINSFTIEYFNLGVNPIFREVYAVGGGTSAPKGFRITESCIGCGTCLEHCPQKCIIPGDIYKIQPEHCLHCGACFENCPAGAVVKLEQEST